MPREGAVTPTQKPTKHVGGLNTMFNTAETEHMLK